MSPNMDQHNERPARSPLVYLLFGSVGTLIVVLVFLVYVAPPENTATIAVDPGDGITEIADELQSNELLRSPFFFAVYVRLTGHTNDFHAGTYSLQSGNIPSLVDRFVLGEPDNEIARVTLIEGWTAEDMAEELTQNGLDGADFLQAVEEGRDVDVELPILAAHPKPKNASWEGYLFPDTYDFFLDSTGDEILVKLLTNFDAKFTDDMTTDLASSPYSLFEVLTFASVVEKEVVSIEDRKVVAGIFIAREQDGYLLESDATINYITGKGTTRPSLTDLEAESLYNTYKNPGLPPGPISNPALSAIQAVLDPTTTDYYFFLTTPEGETIFSETFDEHLENKYAVYGN